MPEFGWWTTISAVLVAFISGVVGPYLAARVHLRAKGITPDEAVQATNRAGYRHRVDESVRLAVEIAHDAQDAATKAEKETADVVEKNNVLIKENEQLRGRIATLELAVKEIPHLQRQLKRLRIQLRIYQRSKPAKRKR